MFVHDKEGNIVKGVPVRVVDPSYMKVVAHPFPESRQLVVDRLYYKYTNRSYELSIFNLP